MGLTGEIGHGTFSSNGRGELRPQGRGWTPASLSVALREAGFTLCDRTIRRAALRGEIPHTLTSGGHVRLDPVWVETTFPQVLAARDRTAA